MTVQEFQAKKIQRNAHVLAHFVATTPEDKLDWCPSTGPESCSRSVLNQIGECIWINRRFAAVLQGKEPPPKVEVYQATSAQAQLELVESAKELAALLKAGSGYINTWGAGDPAAPFGGYKASGIGREKGHHNLDAYLETKSVFVQL